MNITEFLLARIAEDEQLWRTATENGVLMSVPGAQDVYAPSAVAAQLLAECQAKRAILEEWARLNVDARDLADPEAMIDEIRTGLVWAYLDIFKHLAAVYADHPDYDPAWRP